MTTSERRRLSELRSMVEGFAARRAAAPAASSPISGSIASPASPRNPSLARARRPTARQ